jgi:hypothetical protein
VLTLITREIRDNILYTLAPCTVSVMAIGCMIYASFARIGTAAIIYPTLLLLVSFVGFTVLGAAQMYSDRVNRISSLLSTLAVTRHRILAARVLVGILAVLLATVPVMVTTVILLRLFVPPLEFYRRMVMEISLTAVLMGIACYFVGLLVGWTANRAWLLLGGSILLILCVSLVGVKGFGPEAMLILLVFGTAALVRTWHKFTSVSL